MNQQLLDRSEFKTALLARKDLGPEIEPVLIESFARRVAAETRRQQTVNSGGMPQMLIPAGQSRVQRYDHSYSAMGLVITSMILAIPLTATTLAYDGTLMGMVIWMRIVGINFAAVPENFKFNDFSSCRRLSSG